jgi:hypothetical protein
VIYIFTATDPQCPPSCKWVAGHLPEGAAHFNWLCSSDTPAGARAKMEAFLQPPKRIADTKRAVIIPGEPEPETAPVSVADDGEVL